MGCPVCQQDMIKSKVGYLCLNCGNLVVHGHSAIKPPADTHHESHHEHAAHHEAPKHEHHVELKPGQHEVHVEAHQHIHQETKKTVPAKKAAPARKAGSGTKVAVKTRTVSDIKRTAHS